MFPWRSRHSVVGIRMLEGLLLARFNQVGFMEEVEVAPTLKVGHLVQKGMMVTEGRAGMLLRVGVSESGGIRRRAGVSSRKVVDVVGSLRFLNVRLSEGLGFVPVAVADSKVL